MALHPFNSMGKGNEQLAIVVCPGKSFLLESLFLWCLCENMRTKAVAPTGIAAANIDIEGCDVSACTLHYAFDLDASTKSKLDFAKLSNTKVAQIMSLDVLFMDEAGV